MTPACGRVSGAAVRALRILGGVIYYVAGTAVAYQLSAGAVPRAPRLTPAAPPAHPAAAARRPSPTPAVPRRPEPAWEAPPPLEPDTPAPPPAAFSPRPATPFEVTPVVPPPTPRRLPAPVPAAPPPPVAADPFGEPSGVCLVCGARADSWVEVDGRRQGYCLRHQSKVKVPVPPPAPLPQAAPLPPDAVAESPGAGQAEAGAPVQCMGVTRAGARCRRMTRSATGLCYQHAR